jgi:hypothetical protein
MSSIPLTKRQIMEGATANLIYLLRLLSVVDKRGPDREIWRSRHFFNRQQMDNYIARMIKIQGRY